MSLTNHVLPGIIVLKERLKLQMLNHVRLERTQARKDSLMSTSACTVRRDNIASKVQ